MQKPPRRRATSHGFHKGRLIKRFCFGRLEVNAMPSGGTVDQGFL